MGDLSLVAYFAEWIALYKKGALRPQSYKKYETTLYWLKKIAPHVTINQLNSRLYQQIINQYAICHEKTTVRDFHNHLKSAILDLVDEHIIHNNPTRRAIIKGKMSRVKKPKFISQGQLKALIGVLEINQQPNWDFFILVLAKTGLRFAEALAITPSDIDFTQQQIKINKSWNYKAPHGGFSLTKNISSNRIVPIDGKLTRQLQGMSAGLPYNQPIFVQGPVYNSTVNHRLKKLCQKANIPIISLHSLRHSHASCLIFAGVSIASIAKRLGHANITTTQKVYLHIIQELESRDNQKITEYLAGLD